MTDWLLCLIAVELALLVWRAWRVPAPIVGTFVAQTSATPEGEVTLMRRVAGRWEPFASRPSGHHDIREALDTPGLAIERSGRIEVGRQ